MNFGSPPVRYMGGQQPLGYGLTWREVQHFMITAAIGGWVARPVVSLGMGLLHWNYHVFKDQTNWLELDTWITPPGGGGPGSVVTSTTPPSITATGASLAQPGKTEGPARASKRGSRTRRKCKPGHYWNGRKCVRIPEKGWRDFSRKYD